MLTVWVLTFYLTTAGSPNDQRVIIRDMTYPTKWECEIAGRDTDYAVNTFYKKPTDKQIQTHICEPKQVEDKKE